jgi:hypothetical protein
MKNNFNKLYIIILVLILSLIVPYMVKKQNNRTISSEPKGNTFEYVYNKERFILKIDEENKEIAFKKAAKQCFQYFTKGVYPGEENGLDIIDACANPRKSY